jgi:hypothetical protein
MNGRCKMRVSVLLAIMMAAGASAAMVSPAASQKTDMAAGVSSSIGAFSAEWIHPITASPIIDGAVVPLTAVILAGYTDPLAAVDIEGPNDTFNLVADGTGYYEQDPMPLVEGLNFVTVSSTTSLGDVSLLKAIVSDTYCSLIILETSNMTRNSTVEINGLSEPGASVTVEETPVSVNVDGSFSAIVTLTEGENGVHVNATDGVGNTATKELQIVLDTTPPSLAISAPASGSNVSQPSVAVQGTTEAGATVWVNGVVASNGTAAWSARVVLAEGNNTILVLAQDAAGNFATQSILVAYMPVDYVTPDELAAAQTMLMGLINNLTTALQENVSALDARLDGLDLALAENVTSIQENITSALTRITAFEDALLENISNLQGQINATVNDIAALEADVAAIEADITALQTSLSLNVSDLQDKIDSAIGSISALQISLEENVTALESADNATSADLQANVTALNAAIVDNATSLQSLITTLDGDVGVIEAKLNAQSDDLNAAIDEVEDELIDAQVNLLRQINGLNETTKDDVTKLKEKVDDTEAFATMLMYLTLILFAIAVILVGLVWYMMSNRIGRGPEGSGEALEEVEEMPSEIEREFEALEREIKDEEM